MTDLVAVDFDATKTPEPCGFCPSWRFEWVDVEGQGSQLREWHLLDCPKVIGASE